MELGDDAPLGVVVSYMIVLEAILGIVKGTPHYVIHFRGELPLVRGMPNWAKLDWHSHRDTQTS